MKNIYVIALTVVAATLAAGVPAIGQEDEPRAAQATTPAPGGMLGTMPHGTYQCALPGDAGSSAFVVQQEESFRIFTASRYESTQGAGTYILRGDAMTFTRGPRKGERFERIGENQLRKIAEDGSRTRLLCTRIGSR